MRFANQRIADLVKYIETPHIDRDRLPGDPYFYSKNEQEWRRGQDEFHQDIRDRGISNASIQNDLIHDLGMTEGEANAFINFSMKHPNTRHVEKGVPHAYTTEEVARQALLASGVNAQRINTDSYIATDLRGMINDLDTYIDVQMNYPKGGNSNQQVISVVNSLPSYGKGLPSNIQREAGPNASLQQVLKLVNQMSGGQWNRDKFLESQRSRESTVKPPAQDKVKDMLIVGDYDRDRIRNLTPSPVKGSYNPQAPKNLRAIDLNELRKSGLLNMSMRDLRGEGGSLQFYDDSARQGGGKIKLRLPNTFIEKYGSPQGDVLDPRVIEELNSLS